MVRIYCDMSFLLLLSFIVGISLNCESNQVQKEFTIQKDENLPVKLNWKLDSIIENKFNAKNDQWLVEKKSIFYYDYERQIDTLCIVYHDYVADLDKYNTRIENRINSHDESLSILNSPDIAQWTSEKGDIVFHNMTKSVNTKKIFRWNNDNEIWEFNRLEIDSMNEQGKLVYKYLKYISSEGYTNESKTENQYQDTLLTDYVLKSKNHNTGGQWRNGTRKTYKYDESGYLIEETTLAGDGEKNAWRPIRKKEWERASNHGGAVAQLFSNYSRENRWQVEDKLEYELDGNGKVKTETYYRWDHDKKLMIKDWKKENTLDEKGQTVKVYQTNFANSGYDEVLYSYEYDEKGRMLSEEHVNKNKDDKEWRFVRKKIFEYKHPTQKKFTSKKEYWSSNTIANSEEFELDKFNNVKTVLIEKGQKPISKVSANFHYDMPLSTVLLPVNLDYEVRTVNGPWPVSHAIKERSIALYIDNKWMDYKKVKFFYSSIP